MEGTIAKYRDFHIKMCCTYGSHCTLDRATTFLERKSGTYVYFERRDGKKIGILEIDHTSYKTLRTIELTNWYRGKVNLTLCLIN